MVKSNKFDYTGRISSGSKLGKSIAADLEKRADKKQREALKPLAKQTFKSHFSSGRSSKKEKPSETETDKGEKDASKHDTHKLDIKVPGKALGDDGFALMCDGLEKALLSCLDLALVDLNVSNNALSTRSLARLAPIIRQSQFNLQTLDLSKNNFKVSTTAEARDWESFLCAFRDCMTLRRLDFADNPTLGPWAMEILARVYDREPLVEPLPATGAQSTITLPDDDSFSSADVGSLRSDQSFEKVDDHLHRCANGKTLADTWDLGYRRGLRSLPYLTLTNVGLTDTGALFLSFVVEQHHYPTQLITEVNAAEATTQVRTYRQDANTKGIDWDDNLVTLGKDGLHLLQCAEKQRARNVLGDGDSITSSAYEIIRPADFQEHTGSNRRLHSVNGRRTSIRSIHSTEYSMYDKSDIGSARKKIQRNTIIQSGCRSVELWHAALKAIAYSRLIYVLAPEPYNHHATTSGLVQDSVHQELERGHGSDTAEPGFEKSMSDLSMKQSLSPIEENRDIKPSYAATLKTSTLGNGDEHALTMTDVTNITTVPTVLSSTRSSSLHQRDDDYMDEKLSRAVADLADPSLRFRLAHALNDPTDRDYDTSPHLKYQVHRMQQLQEEHGGRSDGYRDARLRCQLPLPVCLQILGYAMDPHDLSILKLQQQRTAFEWGQKRNTLRSELEWRRKDESSQILMVLASAECVDC